MNRNSVLTAVIVVSLAIGWLVGRHDVEPLGSLVADRSSNTSVASGTATGGAVAVRAFFNSDCEQALVDAIDGATNEVLVAIYSMTRRSLTAAMARAAQRGVKVSVRYDGKSAEESRDMPEAIAFLKRRKVQCEAVGFGDSRARMHNKFTVVDRRVVLTGSYNYTSTASEQNRENLVIIESAIVAAAYVTEFRGLLSYSRP